MGGHIGPPLRDPLRSLLLLRKDCHWQSAAPTRNEIDLLPREIGGASLAAAYLFLLASRSRLPPRSLLRFARLPPATRNSVGASDSRLPGLTCRFGRRFCCAKIATGNPRPRSVLRFARSPLETRTLRQRSPPETRTAYQKKLPNSASIACDQFRIQTLHETCQDFILSSRCPLLLYNFPFFILHSPFFTLDFSLPFLYNVSCTIISPYQRLWRDL